MSGFDPHGPCPTCGVNVDPDVHDCPIYDRKVPVDAVDAVDRGALVERITKQFWHEHGGEIVGDKAMFAWAVDRLLDVEFVAFDWATNEGVAAEIARLTAGAADEPGHPDEIPTPAQWIRRFLNADGPTRLERIESVQSAAERGVQCWVQNHDRLSAEVERLRNELRRVNDRYAKARNANSEHSGRHTVRWRVLSEDGTAYGVKPNTRETAERECNLLRQPNEDGYSEPRARVIKERTCSWAENSTPEPPVTAEETMCPTCGKARGDLSPGLSAEGWGVCPESFHFRVQPTEEATR